MSIGTITVIVHGEPIRVRPTMRAAHALNEQHSDVGALATRALNGQISAIFTMVREGCVDCFDVERFERAAARPLAGWHTSAVSEFAAKFAPALLCVDIDAIAEEPPRPIEPTPYTKVLADLYAKATGWLGWSPEQAWNATPLEILTAVNAHVEKLRLMAGAKDDEEDTSEDLDRAGLAELATMNTL